MSGQSRRLDSWKEVADYLGRDVRTAMRWAQTQGLPIRRVGGRGRSVFAFSHEIDDWLASAMPIAQAETPVPASTPSEIPPRDPATPSSLSRPVARFRTRALIAGLLLIALGLTAGSQRGDNGHDRIDTSESAVAIFDGRGGVPRPVVRFDEAVAPTYTSVRPQFHDVDADGVREVMVGVSFYVDHNRRMPKSGELLNVSREGILRWRFGFDDVITFGQERFDGPWGLTDWIIGPAAPPARIAVATHHHTWWASMAAVLDHTGRRLSTFVNPGWIESLLWIDGARLAAAGFNNARDAAMFAVVATDAGDTQAPGTAGTPFACISCTGGAPIFYATFSRSELNVATAARFNRAQIARTGDRLTVTTIEIPGDPLAATAIYEFDHNLRLLRARYDDAYWTLHSRLERQGELRHTRETCPERSGPPAIQIWGQSAGWVATPPAIR